MPDSYQNPSYKPPTRPYKWVPNVIPNGGDTPNGFYSTQIVRGAFRNDVPLQDGFSGETVIVTTSGDLISTTGSENYPILKAHRPREDPSNDRGTPPSEDFNVKGADFDWSVELIQSSRISSITLDYALIVDINDPELLNLLDSEDKASLQRYLQNPTTEPPGIDWSKYKFAKISLDDVEYPVSTNGDFKELSVTGITKSLTTHTVKFVDSFASSDFPTVKKISISNRVQLSTLELILGKVSIFNAERVNLHDEQLPCSLMEYAYPVRFSFNPTPIMNAQRLPFPSDAANPNFHIKLFSPDERIASQYGLAHSINLRFLIFSMPILGIDPTGLNPLYFVVFIGPTPGKKTAKISLSGKLSTSNIINVNKNRVVNCDYFLIEKDTQSLRLEKIASDASISSPESNADWKRVENSTYNILGENLFSNDGPYVGEYLFLDDSTSEHDWYRVVQSLASGAEKYSSPFKNSTYSEKVVYSGLLSSTTTTKKDTIIRRPVLLNDLINQNPLNIKNPIAVFTTDGFDAFSSVNQFRAGSFKLAIRAKAEDKDFLLNTHIFARFWFVPFDSDVDVNNLYAYRNDENEFHFESTATGTKLVTGPPQNMQQVIITPPIPGELTYLEVTRYSDEILSKPSENQKMLVALNQKMLVALYSVAYPTADGGIQGVNKNTANLPKITIELDTQFSSFETTLEQTTSNVLFAQRGSEYNSSQFRPLEKPLIVNINKIGGGTLESGEFPIYSAKFKSQDSKPFDGLLKLEKDNSGNIAKFCIPISSVPTELSEQTSVYADFATSGVSLDSGRVLNGNWDIECDINRDIDTGLVAIDLRIEMFLVNNNGTVTERIFRSSLIKGVSNTGDAKIVYSANIQLPMIISSGGTQLVARIIGYPYSRDGNELNIQDIQSQLGGVPLGLRIESFKINEHTISSLSISQTSSTLGSPSFYEDLQLTPNQSIGETSDFWFIASDFLTNTIVVDATRGIDITGCLYSPAWFINMPKDMEVKARGQGFRDNDVWFRTVVADGATGTTVLSAAEDKLSKTVHLAHESKNDVSSQSISMMSDSSTINHKTFDSPYRNSTQSNDVAGKNDNTISKLGNISPNIYFANMGGFNNSSQAALVLISESNGNDYASSQANINTSLGGYGTWFGANRNLGGSDFSVIKKLSEGISNFSIAQSPVSSLSYIVGWAEPGSILMKEASIWDSNPSIAPGSIYLIDGLVNDPLPDSSSVIYPTFTSGLKASQSHPGIAIDSFNQIVISYTLEGKPSELIARNFVGGRGLSNPYTIASFRGNSLANSNIEIFSPTMCYYPPTQTYYVAMWCSGKIFITTFSGLKSSNGVILNPIQLVAGDKDFLNNKNEAHATFQTLVQDGIVQNNVLGVAEDDVPNQRVGLIVSDKWPFQGNAFVYYKNNNDKLMVRQIRICGITGPQKEVV